MGNIAQLFGGSSEKADRKAELDARDQSRNVFSYALPEAKGLEASGKGLSGEAGAYFGRLLKSGRTDTTQQAAPAVNAELSAADAAKRREALTGTGRTGGTAEADRMAEGETQGKIADTVNQTDQQNKAVAAQGEGQIGSDQMSKALAALGLSAQQITALMNSTQQSRKNSDAIRNQDYNGVASDIGGAIAGAFL